MERETELFKSMEVARAICETSNDEYRRKRAALFDYVTSTMERAGLVIKKGKAGVGLLDWTDRGREWLEECSLDE